MKYTITLGKKISDRKDSVRRHSSVEKNINAFINCPVRTIESNNNETQYKSNVYIKIQ